MMTREKNAMTEHYLDFLRWLSQHGIDPELPLILCSMAMGGFLVWHFRNWRDKHHGKRKEL